MNEQIRFIVPFHGDIAKTTQRIFYHLIIHRIKEDKPAVILITGQSGEGKSNCAIEIVDKLYKLQGINLEDHIEDVVIMDINEFRHKVKRLLQDKELKQLNCMIIDEARKTVNSQDWASLVNRTVAMVNALSRAIKPMAIFIVAQSLKDIDRATRDTINFYMKVKRTSKGEVQHSKIYEFWVDDRNLDKPVTKKQLVRGVVQTMKGKEVVARDVVTLSRIKIPKVRKEVWKKYNDFMVKAKNKMLEDEFDTLAKALEAKNTDKAQERINQLSEYLVGRKDILNSFGSYKRKRWRLNSSFEEAFNITPGQRKEVEQRISNYFKKQEGGTE